MNDPYLWLKYTHILSSTLLFGTGIGTAFQMVWAFKSGSAKIIHRVAKGVVLADWLFTTPAGIVQPITGLWLVYLSGFSVTEPWLLSVYALYLLAFLCWAPVVHLQIRIRDLTGPSAEIHDDSTPMEAKRLFRMWLTLGWPAFLALMGIFWLMVFKPGLWG
ncbi:MAG: DUF2269 domain-containing protein [Alphaproteobacteria bacterium]|nr:DUF2269 domain-containing protein [Alphaproteobacteria bacterium]